MEQGTLCCPNCRQELDASAIAPGQAVNCPYCRQVFTPVVPADSGFYPPKVNYATPAGFGRDGVKAPNPLATASLVCALGFFGLLGIAILMGISGIALAPQFIGTVALACPLVAFVLGVIAYRRAWRGDAGGKGAAICGMVLGGVSILLIVGSVLMVPSRGRPRVVANRVKCGSCMRQIGQAIWLYSNENKGLYPPRLEDLILTQDITSDVFVCPSTNHTAAPGATPQQQAAAMSSRPGHVSFVYVGQKMNSTAGANVVVLYEPLSNHNQAGSNMLFGDGHVDWVEAKQAAKIIAEVQAGQNPPPSYK